jgi:phosphatidylglycerophosphatase C
VPDRRIAAFDFDGTLTRRDTLLPFLVRACGSLAVARAVSRVAPVAARARVSRLEAEVHHRDATKAALLHALLAGRDAAWFAEAGRSYAQTLGARVRPEMADQVAWHRDHGHELVIVSASLLTYLGPFAEEQGFDHVIAVEMEVDDAGRLTGNMTGPNVRGPEKVVRLRHWLDGSHPEVLWGYGNSSGDEQLLQIAHIPVWVNRRAEREAADRL